jgi:hypothetical protein
MMPPLVKYVIHLYVQQKKKFLIELYVMYAFELCLLLMVFEVKSVPFAKTHLEHWG